MILVPSGVTFEQELVNGSVDKGHGAKVDEASNSSVLLVLNNLPGILLAKCIEGERSWIIF